MKYYRLVSSTTPSCLQEWLGEELENCGIDSVYTRYILSVLQQDSVDIEPFECCHQKNKQQKLLPKYGGPESQYSVAKSKRQNWKTWNNHILLCSSTACRITAYSDLEKLKKNIAIDCLRSASDDINEVDIRELIDEVCVKLKNIKNLTGEKEETAVRKVNALKRENAFYISSSSPTEEIKKYFAAFPPLNGKTDQNTELRQQKNLNPWCGNCRLQRKWGRPNCLDVGEPPFHSHVSTRKERKLQPIIPYGSLRAIKNVYWENTSSISRKEKKAPKVYVEIYDSQSNANNNMKFMNPTCKQAPVCHEMVHSLFLPYENLNSVYIGNSILFEVNLLRYLGSISNIVLQKILNIQFNLHKNNALEMKSIEQLVRIFLSFINCKDCQHTFKIKATQKHVESDSTTICYKCHSHETFNNKVDILASLLSTYMCGLIPLPKKQQVEAFMMSLKQFHSFCNISKALPCSLSDSQDLSSQCEFNLSERSNGLEAFNMSAIISHSQTDLSYNNSNKNTYGSPNFSSFELLDMGSYPLTSKILCEFKPPETVHSLMHLEKHLCKPVDNHEQKFLFFHHEGYRKFVDAAAEMLEGKACDNNSKNEISFPGDLNKSFPFDDKNAFKPGKTFSDNFMYKIFFSSKGSGKRVKYAFDKVKLATDFNQEFSHGQKLLKKDHLKKADLATQPSSMPCVIISLCDELTSLFQRYVNKTESNSNQAGHKYSKFKCLQNCLEKTTNTETFGIASCLDDSDQLVTSIGPNQTFQAEWSGQFHNKTSDKKLLSYWEDNCSDIKYIWQRNSQADSKELQIFEKGVSCNYSENIVALRQEIEEDGTEILQGLFCIPNLHDDCVTTIHSKDFKNFESYVFGGKTSIPSNTPNFSNYKKNFDSGIRVDFDVDMESCRDNCKSGLPDSQTMYSSPSYIYCDDQIYSAEDFHGLNSSALQDLYGNSIQNSFAAEGCGWSMGIDNVSERDCDSFYDQSYTLDDFAMVEPENSHFSLLSQDEAQYISEIDKVGVKRNLCKWPSSHIRKRVRQKYASPPWKRPCAFFLEGSCRRLDCKFSHDLSSITCRFWEEGSCFKGDLCPFLHGYVNDEDFSYQDGCLLKNNAPDRSYSLESEADFPSLLAQQCEGSTSKSDVVDFIQGKGAVKKWKKSKSQSNSNSSANCEQEVSCSWPDYKSM